MENKKDNHIKIITGAFVFTALAVGYYFFILVPKQQKFEREQVRQAHIEKCLEKAEDLYLPIIDKLINDSFNETEDTGTRGEAISATSGLWQQAKMKCNNL